MKKVKNFRVPGRDIKVRLHELLFIETHTFQRLHNIKQLGLANFVYPSAVHTRALHCLDCLDMAQRFIDALSRNINNEVEASAGKEKSEFLKILENDTDTIRAGALLHDITHIPYSHTLEDENNILPQHDKSVRIQVMIDKMKQELESLESNQYRTFSFFNQQEFEKIKEKCQRLLDEVKKILWTIALHSEIEERIKSKEKIIPPNEIFKKVKNEIEEKYRELLPTQKFEILEAGKYYIADIIGNTISADLLSYVLMDPEFTGTEGKPGGWYRLFDYFHLVKDDVGRIRLAIKLKKQGEWRLDVLSTILRVLNSRYEVTELINYHHAKLSASAMLGKVCQFCKLSESGELYDLGDEGFFKLLEKKIENNTLIEIEGWDQARVKKGAQMLLENLKCRRLHKRFHMVKNPMSPRGYDLSEKYKDPKERLNFEKRIIDDFGLTPGQIILFCLERKGFMKEARTLVTLETIDVDGSLKTRNLPLNDDECIAILENEVGKSTAQRIRDVEEQYIDLWKLYVFVDPKIIPYFGYDIKKILNKELGHCASFDLAYLAKMPEYKISEIFSEELGKVVPEAEKPSVSRFLPEAITALATRGKIGDFSSLTEQEIKLMIEYAIERYKNPQRKLEEI